MSDAPKTYETHTVDLPKGWHARIPAHWLPRLAPLCGDGEPRPYLAGIRIEPVEPAGGCLLIATDGCAMAVVHEPAAICSQAATLTFPPTLVEACRPVDLPLLDRDGGWPERPTPPKWITPDTVICSTAAAMVTTGGKKGGALHHAFRPVPGQRVLSPDRDFTVGLGDWLDWRSALRALGGARPAPAILDLKRLSRFAALCDERNRRLAAGWRVWHVAVDGGESGPRGCDALTIRNESLPGFFGVLMGRAPEPGVDLTPVPDWLGLGPVPSEAAA